MFALAFRPQPMPWPMTGMIEPMAALPLESNQGLLQDKMPPMPAYTSTLTDAELVARLAHGDEAAFGELYDRYNALAYGLALRVTNHSARAEEIVQDSFMKLWRNPRSFDATKASLSTFLITMVRNAAIDALRAERPTNSLDDEEGNPLPIASLRTGPLEQAELMQHGDNIRAAMRKLSEAHRRTVELAYFEGQSREEIAIAMAVPVGTVKSRLKYALDKLRASLGFLLVPEES
jgi:RNA polymerase sigma-70 factor, ECF subfamily